MPYMPRDRAHSSFAHASFNVRLTAITFARSPAVDARTHPDTNSGKWAGDSQLSFSDAAEDRLFAQFRDIDNNRDSGYLVDSSQSQLQ